MPPVRPNVQTPRRSGAIAPLAAILTVFLLGMIAFAVDISWIALTSSQLQSDADAAALAGVQQLMNNYALYIAPGQTPANKTALLDNAMAQARATARQFAKANSAGGAGSLALLDADVEFGFRDAKGKYTPYGGSSNYPNTIKLLLRRDGRANTQLGLFFAPVLGVRTVNVLGPASATLYVSTVVGFKPGKPIRLLPITYDVNHWNNFIATGEDPDGDTYRDADNNPELPIYPSIKFSGNFGELSLDDSHNGSGEISGWIDNGVPASAIQALIDANLIPLPKHGADKWDWQGNPGLKGSTIATVNAHVGEVYYLPLYKPVHPNANDYEAGIGSGSGYFYNIVAFVPVTIMPPGQNGKEVIVRPAVGYDASFDFGSNPVVPLGTPTEPVTTFSTPKLTG